MDPKDEAMQRAWDNARQAAAMNAAQQYAGADLDDLLAAQPGSIIRVEDPDRHWFMREAKRENRRNQRLDFLIGCSVLLGGLMWAGVGAAAFVWMSFALVELVRRAMQ